MEYDMSNGWGGRRPGSGRKIGSSLATKAEKAVSRQIANKLAEDLPANIQAMMPGDVMLTAMRLQWCQFEETRDPNDLNLAVRFAEKAAPYCHAKLQNIQVEGEVTSKVEDMSNEQLAQILTGAITTTAVQIADDENPRLN